MKFECAPNHELRGLMIRLYPTKEQEDALTEIEDALRYSWNSSLVAPGDTVIKARQAYALRYELVGPRPPRPDFGEASEERKAEWAEYQKAYKAHKAACKAMGRRNAGPPPAKPEKAPETDAVKAVWKAYGEACREWHHTVYLATKDVPACAFRPGIKSEMERFGFKQNYQLLAHLMDAADEFHGTERKHKPGAHAFQSLVKNFFSGKAADGKGLAKGQRRKKFRREWDVMPLQVRSGDCFKLGTFGSRGRNENYYDCAVSFPGVRGKILGRLPGRAPWGRVLEGVSISRQADGWWAAILQEVPKRILPQPVKGSVVGIDVGLYVIAAFNCEMQRDEKGQILSHVNPKVTTRGTLITNPRGKAFSEMIAGRQAQKLDTGRLHQRAKRHTKHLIYNEVVKALEYVETIYVEKLPPHIGHMGSDIYSVMRKVVRMLQERYGSRVVERDPSYTSQVCSGCGHHSKATWEFRSGESPFRTCPVCGAHKHRDHNAACNLALPEDVWNARLVKAGLREAEKKAA